MAGMPASAPERNPFSASKTGGLRTQDNNVLSKTQEKRKQEAIMLVNSEDFVGAARIFEEVNMQREAIEILEKHGYLDEAAAILMKINRPNRAAVIYERNRNFAQATAYYLRAKMLEDAKRCFKKIESFDFGLSSELALLFSEAGDKSEAFRIFATINDRARILKIARDTMAFTELAVFLDKQVNRALLLDSISVEDLEKILESMPSDKTHPLQRVLLWINEGNRGDFLLPAIKYIGDKRDVAQKLLEQVNTEALSNFGLLIQGHEPDFLSKNIKSMEWCARALHDAKLWHTAALAYEKLGSQVMAGKCWAMCGNVEKAIGSLRTNPGDLPLLQNYSAALAKLGINPSSPRDLTPQESESLALVFHNVDPDVEKNRVDSPFSIAS
jgi:tetratricopeptide (TPR) repeat protein